MVLKFCANISFMFAESGNLLERYQLAKKAGFRGVECAYPTGFTFDEIVAAKREANIAQVLINTCNEDIVGGEFGSAALPGKQEEFKRNFQKTLDLATALNCKKIHIMAGKFSEPTTLDHDDVYVENLKHCAKELQQRDMIGLIEPINKYALPGYFLNSYDKAVQVLNEVNSPHIRLLLDIYHLQHIQGNISRSMEELMPHVGHIQIAQAPHRNEPNSPGEINYKFVLDAVYPAGYKDWIGLEYHPKTYTKDGLGWIEEYGFTL